MLHFSSLSTSPGREKRLALFKIVLLVSHLRPRQRYGATYSVHLQLIPTHPRLLSYVLYLTILSSKKYSATVEFVFIVSPWREGIDYVIV
jgi:hypothetical protein